MKENLINTKKDSKLIFFNEAVEYINKFDNLSQINSFEDNNRKPWEIFNNNQLRDEMLSELDHLKYLILNNPDRKIKQLSKKEKKKYNEFIKYFSSCPVCGNFNHYYNLKHMYFDNKLINLKKSLINLMHTKNRNMKKFKIIFGIPCCSCYKEFFE